MTTNHETWIDYRGADGTPCWTVEQRNVGFADNDGRWIAQRVRGNRWTAGGVLEPVGESAFLGVFDTEAEALAAVDADRELVAA